MTLTDSLYAYARALEERHLARFRRCVVRVAVNDNFKGWAA